MMRTFLTAGFAAAALFAAAPAVAGEQKAASDGYAEGGCGFAAVTTASAAEDKTTKQAEAKARVKDLLDAAITRTETASARQSPIVYPPSRPGS